MLDAIGSKSMEMGEGVNGPGGTDAKAKPRVVKVAYLHGDDQTPLSGTGNQFVNLPRDEKWVDGTLVPNIDRLGLKPRIKVCFDKPGAHNFKLKFKPGSSNAAYTGSEQGRNPHFKFQDAEKSYTTDGDGTKVIENDFFVTAAGSDSYELVAKDDEGNEVTSSPLTTHRLVHYVELKMRGLTAVANNLSTMKDEFAHHNIQMVGLPSVEMEHMPNISQPDMALFMARARTAYLGSQGPSKEPYVIAVAYTDQLAVKDLTVRTITSGAEVGPGEADIEIDITDRKGNERFLWNKVVPGEGWFVSATFLKDGGTPEKDEVTIPEADCTLVPDNPAVPEMSSQVRVKVSGLPAGKGTITLNVYWVDRMRGGISLGAGNAICVCTRAWWETRSNEKQMRTMIHELGHQFGMVATGSGKGPDRVSTHYDTSKGHIGDHCHQGLPVQAEYSDPRGSTCVMFGAANNTTAFCANCAPAARKQDLGDGFARF